MNTKKELIVALKEAIGTAEKLEATDKIPVVILQYRIKEKRYLIDFHTIK